MMFTGLFGSHLGVLVILRCLHSVCLVHKTGTNSPMTPAMGGPSGIVGSARRDRSSSIAEKPAEVITGK